MFVKIVCVFVLGLLLFGCNPSAENISETVKVSMQNRFYSNPAFSKYHLKVNEVKVIHDRDNHYQGIAKVEFEGVLHNVPVDVTASGKDVMWKVEPGSFGFIVAKELEKLGDSFQ
jgi:hypothetical protein